ncbi:MAG: hypothetical protein ABI391_06940 [Hyphomicrobiaceae bacterium]
MTDEMHERQDTMQRDVLLVATAATSLINGQGFSPIFDPVFFLLRPFIVGTFLSTPLVFFYLTSIFISLMTLLIGGVPAAIYERVRGSRGSTPISIGIWFLTTAVLTIPALIAYFTAD